MTIETEVANLTQQTTALLSAVNLGKSVLDQRVADATAQANQSTAQAGNAASSATSSGASASASAGSAASALAIYGTTGALQTKLTEAAAQSSAAQSAVASASSILQQDLSAISAALHCSPNVIAAMFIYDTSLDSDGGAWVERMQHTSWFNEPLNGAWRGWAASEAACRAISGAATGDYFGLTTDGKFYKLNATSGVMEAFRGNKAKFPRLAAIVAEASSVTIYDLTAPGRPMWRRMVPKSLANIGDDWWREGGRLVTSVAAVNGKLCIGLNNGSDDGGSGLAFVDFPKSVAGRYAGIGVSFGGIVPLAMVGSMALDDSLPKLVYSQVNAVAMTVLPDAPVDVTTGMQVPTIAVATSGGVSIILHDGSVTNKVWAHAAIFRVALSGSTVFTSGGAADSFWGNMAWNYVTGAEYCYGSGGAALFPFVAYNNTNGPVAYAKSVVAVAATSSAVGKVALLQENIGTKSRGAVAYMEAGFNTGYMVGDIRRCYMADTVVESTGPSVELVSNGTFDTDLTGWAVAPGYAATALADAGEMQITSIVDWGGYIVAIPTVIGKSYRLTGTERRISGTGNVYVTVTSVAGVDIILAGFTVSSAVATPSAMTFTATATTTYICARCCNAGAVGGFDNISVKEVIADRSYKAAGANIYGTLVKSPVA